MSALSPKLIEAALRADCSPFLPPELEDQFDPDIRRLCERGLTFVAIARRLHVPQEWLRQRRRVLGLLRPRSLRAAGLSEAEAEVYRLYRRKGFSADEARAAALGSAP